MCMCTCTHGKYFQKPKCRGTFLLPKQNCGKNCNEKSRSFASVHSKWHVYFGIGHIIFRGMDVFTSKETRERTDKEIKGRFLAWFLS